MAGELGPTCINMFNLKAGAGRVLPGLAARVTWDLTRNASSHAPPQTCGIQQSALPSTPGDSDARKNESPGHV